MVHRKFPVKGFPGKCEPILSFFRICSHLPKKFVMESFVFMCSVNIHFKCFFLTFNVNLITLHKKTKFSIKDFFSKCDQSRSPNPQFHADLVTFTEETFNENIHFLCRVTVTFWKFSYLKNLQYMTEWFVFLTKSCKYKYVVLLITFHSYMD